MQCGLLKVPVLLGTVLRLALAAQVLGLSIRGGNQQGHPSARGHRILHVLNIFDEPTEGGMGRYSEAPRTTNPPTHGCAEYESCEERTLADSRGKVGIVASLVAGENRWHYLRWGRRGSGGLWGEPWFYSVQCNLTVPFKVVLELVLTDFRAGRWGAVPSC